MDRKDTFTTQEQNSSNKSSERIYAVGFGRRAAAALLDALLVLFGSTVLAFLDVTHPRKNLTALI